MTTEALSPNLPKLRFPEFLGSGDWEARPLDELCERIGETVGDARSTPVDISKGKGFVLREQVLGRDMSPSRYRNRTRLRRGDFAYASIRSKRFPLGTVYRLTDFEEAAVSDDLHCFRLKDGVEPALVMGFFESNGHGRQLVRDIPSGAHGLGPLEIAADSFFGIAVPVPPNAAEWRKVAECLETLDDMIAAEKGLLDALRRHMLGLKQRLFPRTGESMPRIRFPMYRSSERWNVARVGDVADYQSGTHHEEDSSGNGRFIVADPGFIASGGVVAKRTNDEHCIARTGDVLLSLTDLEDAKALARSFLVDADDTYAVDHLVASLRPRAVDAGFLRHVLDRNSWLLSFVDGKIPKRLGKLAVMDFPIAMPRDVDEQRRIVECLGSVESQTVARQSRLDSLERHRHGLLQQLFPSLEIR